MEVVYLGFLSSIFNWVFNAILSPVFKFISKLLEEVLGWIFDKILSPLLQAVLWPMFKAVLDLIYQAFAGVFYSIFTQILRIIDSMQTAFNVFSGLQTVSLSSGSGQYTLMELLFRLPAIQQAVAIITVLAFVMTLGFAALAASRSMLEMDGENQRPISKILRSTAGAMLRFLLIPIVTLFLIVLSSYVLSGISKAAGSTGVTLSRTVFLVSSLDAVGVSGGASFNSSGKLKDTDRAVEVDSRIGTKDDIYRKGYVFDHDDYSDKSKVQKTFNLGRFDYMIGYGVGLFMILVLGTCMINFICRIFEVLLLFVASPLFVSTMPMDDGEKFKGWQDMFIAKIFGGFGSVLAMEIYMLLCPIVMEGQISFVSGKSSAEADYLIRLIFLMGGAWAVVKAGPTVTQLLNYQAGIAEQDNNAKVSAGMMGAAASAGLAAWSVGKVGYQKYQGYKATKQATKEASDRRIKKVLSGGGASGSGEGAALAASGGGTGNASRTAAAATGNAGRTAAAATGNAGRTAAAAKAARRVGTLGGKGHFTENTTEGGHRYLGLDFGKALSFGRDKEGRFRASVLGIGIRKGVDGKTDKVTLPFVRLKPVSEGFKVSKVKLPGVALKRTESVTAGADGSQTRTMGSMYFSDIKPLGVKRRFDQDTGKVEKQQMMFTHYGKDQAAGEYVKTKTEGFGFRTEYKKNDQGEYETTHKRNWLYESKMETDEKGKSHVASVKIHGGPQMYQTEEKKKHSQAKAEASKRAMKKLVKDEMDQR